MSDIRVHWLDNGLTLLIDELPRPAAATQLLVPGGSAADPDGLEGAATVLCRLLQRGAGERDTRALAEAVEGLGYRFSCGANHTGCGLGLVGLADDWPEAVALLADVVTAPHLPDSELEPCRQLALQDLNGLDDEPRRKMSIELRRRFMPGTLGRPTEGSEAGLAALGPAAMRAAYERCITPAGAVMAVAGGIAAERVIERIEALLGGWRGNGLAAPVPATAEVPGWTHVGLETEQVHLGAAYRDLPPDHPAGYHAAMAVEVLSGGGAARLFTEVREKRGLCYTVGAGRASMRGLGWVQLAAGTTTERAGETLEVMLAELRRLPGTVTADEIERGRARLTAAMVMNEESTPSRAARMVSDWVRLDRVRTTDEMRAGVAAVTAAGLNDHLGEHPPGALTVLTLGSEFAWPSGLEL